MDRIEFKWTDGNNEAFQQFYIETEKYYSQIVGGVEKRAGFVPYNLSDKKAFGIIKSSGTGGVL